MSVLDYIIKILERSIEKNSDIPLTLSHLKNILVLAVKLKTDDDLLDPR